MMRAIGRYPTTDSSDRMQSDLEELAARIADALPQDGRREIQPGVHLIRQSHPHERAYASVPPSFCVIAQGSKNIWVGDNAFRYDPAHYLITTMELPLSAAVVEASPEQPYLGFRLALDSSVITSMMVEANGVERSGDGSLKAVDVSPLEADLLDATLRLVRLTVAPDEYRVLAPLVTREIVYRLLIGAQGIRLQHLAKFGGHAHRMARAIEIIRENFNKPLRIEDIANMLHMSVSGFHAHFKAVTAMSPLQFQKQLRLQEARRLMLSENLDAAQAGFRVGYDDASQFSREYKRHFGEPPVRNVERMRGLATASAAS
jgi:AraC-like DNA-binding protein